MRRIIAHGWLDAIGKVNCFIETHDNIKLEGSKLR